MKYVDQDATEFASGRAHEGVAFRDCDIRDRSIDAMTLEESSLTKINGSNVRLTELELADVVVEDCDFANAHWPKASCSEVRVRRSRFTGLNATDARFSNSSFQACKFHLATLHDVHLSDCVFDQCDLREVDFQGAKLNNVVFRKCDLRNARFAGAVVSGLDVRGSHLAGLQIDAESLKGTIVDPSQLIEFSALLGLVVQELDEVPYEQADPP